MPTMSGRRPLPRSWVMLLRHRQDEWRNDRQITLGLLCQPWRHVPHSMWIVVDLSLSSAINTYRSSPRTSLKVTQLRRTASEWIVKKCRFQMINQSIRKGLEWKVQTQTQRQVVGAKIYRRETIRKLRLWSLQGHGRNVLGEKRPGGEMSSE